MVSSVCRPACAPLSLLGLAGLVSAADNWIVAPILPSIATGLGIAVPAAASVLCAYLLPYGLLQPVHGHLAERHGRLRWLCWLMAGLAGGTAGCALAPTLVWLCLARFVTGVFAAGMIAVSLAAIGASVPPDARQSQVGRFMGLVFLGQALGAGFGGLVAGQVGWRAMFALFALLALWVAQRLHRWAVCPPVAVPGACFWPQLLAAARDRKGAAVYRLALATGCLLLGMYGFLGASLQARSGLGPTGAGSVLAGFGLASLATGYRVGAVAGRLGRQLAAAIGALAGALAAAGLAVWHDWPAGLAAALLLGIGYVLVQSALATEAFAVGSGGIASGLVGLGLFGGGALGAAAGGLVLAAGSYRILWQAAAAGCLLLALVILRCRTAFAPVPPDGDAG